MPKIVDVHQLLHLRGRDVVDGAVDAEARVADHHVEPAEVLDGASDQGCHVVFARDVGDDRQRLAARGLDFGGEPLETVAAPRAGHDGRPVARQTQGRRAADAGGGAGDGDDSMLTHGPFSLTC